MDARYDEQGNAILTMTRAEAHVFIWGGPERIAGAVNWNARHALVDAEDRVSEDAYKAIMDEVDKLDASLVPDPIAVSLDADVDSGVAGYRNERG